LLLIIAIALLAIFSLIALALSRRRRLTIKYLSLNMLKAKQLAID